MKKLFLLIAVCLLGVSSPGQTTYYMQGLLRQPDDVTARAYLKITNASGGGGTVTSFSSGNLSPLFTTSVANPTTTPALSYTLTAQTANTFFAGPSVGGPSAPTFRALATADLPFSFGNLTDAGTDGITVTGGTGAVIGSGTSLAQHVADSTHNGYLSSSDWTTFNGKGSGTVVSVTNGGAPLGVSVIVNSNAPIPSLKSFSAGANVTVTDNNGTNIIISATGGGGGGASGSDLLMTNISPYSNGTNFYLDFGFPAATLFATNSIVFNFSTNWGLVNTSRVCNLFIAPTNYLRHVYFAGPATNWQGQPQQLYAVPTGYGATMKFQLFGPGETNVAYEPMISMRLATSNTTASFAPTNIGNLKLWLDASLGVFRDEQTNVLAINGDEVRGWLDLSGFVSRMTNLTSSQVTSFYRSPNNAPGNIPCVNFTPGTAWLESPSFSALSQPLWVFIMAYGRMGPIIFDGVGVNNRIACATSEGGGNLTLFAGANLNVAAAPSVAWRLFAFEGTNNLSVIRTNGVQAASGAAGANTVVGFNLGTDASFSSYVANGFVSEVVVYNSNLTAIQVTNVETYFKQKYGAW